MRYAPLAPTGEIFSAWKAHQDDDLYIRQYNQVVLSRLNPINVRKDLEHLSGGKDVFLLCYENPKDFCHRHRAAKWLSSCGASVTEWEGEGMMDVEWEQMSFLH